MSTMHDFFVQRLDTKIEHIIQSQTITEISQAAIIAREILYCASDSGSIVAREHFDYIRKINDLAQIRINDIFKQVLPENNHKDKKESA